MVDDLQLNRLRCHDQGACQELVLLAGLHVTVRMVVGQHDRGRTAPQRRLDNTAWIDGSSVDRPLFQPFDSIAEQTAA